MVQNFFEENTLARETRSDPKCIAMSQENTKHNFLRQIDIIDVTKTLAAVTDLLK